MRPAKKLNRVCATLSVIAVFQIGCQAETIHEPKVALPPMEHEFLVASNSSTPVENKTPETTETTEAHAPIANTPNAMPEAMSNELPSSTQKSDEDSPSVYPEKKSVSRAPASVSPGEFHENAQQENPTEIKNLAPAAANVSECKLLFANAMQSQQLQACEQGMLNRKKTSANEARTQCSKNNPSVRLSSACQVGVTLASSNSSESNKSFTACKTSYSNETLIDLIFQESCFSGVHADQLLGLQKNISPEAKCMRLTGDRTFLGSCLVGYSYSQLSQSQKEGVLENQKEKCQKYFDPIRFHLGYRACLSAQGLATSWPQSSKQIMKSCSHLNSDDRSPAEKAACIVGASFLSSSFRNQPEAKRLSSCTDKPITYDEKSSFACLAVRSLSEFISPQQMKKACKEIFPQSRRARKKINCTSYL